MADLSAFLGSLRATGSDADVVLFSGNPDRPELTTLKDRFNITVEGYDSVARKLSDGDVHLHRYRSDHIHFLFLTLGRVRGAQAVFRIFEPKQGSI